MNTDTITIDGYPFTLDKKTGYYHCTVLRQRLHQYVWEKKFGPIPEGCHIHHIDHDKSNNDIANLMCMTREAHLKLHGMSEEKRTAMRNKVQPKGVIVAKEWHGSDAGREWHKKHYEQFSHLLHEKVEHTCPVCGKVFMDIKHAVYCSNNCKSKARRASGVDNVNRTCVVCGKTFVVNRYAKTKTCSRECKCIHLHNVRTSKRNND